MGTDGQTQVKDFSSAADAQAALDKQAAGKRKKGYTDDGAASSAPAPAEVAAPSGPQAVELQLEQGGRQIALTLEYDGQTVRTTVAETYDAPDTAAAAFVRIQQALLAEGYKRKA